MKIEVGMKCRQAKVIEKYGFDFLGMEFEITKVTDDVIMGKCYAKGVGFGIEPGEFENYFELIKEEVKEENNNKQINTGKINKAYTCKALPYKVNWEITHNGETTNQTVEYEEQLCKLIINGDATIIIFDDGSKGVARCMLNDEYSLDKGVNIACTKALIKFYQKKLKKMVK